METLRWGQTEAAATIYRVEHRAPDLTRRWYVAPGALYGDYVITVGTISYEYDVKRQKVAIYKNPAIAQNDLRRDNYALLTKNYRVVLGAGEIVVGRQADSINLINDYTGERVMHLAVDTHTHLILERTVYHGDGSIALQARFEALRYTSNIPPAVFATDIPPDFTRTAERDYDRPSSDVAAVASAASFAPRTPQYLPEGFALSSAALNETKGVKTLHLLYSDGIRSLSLFENARGAAVDFGALRSMPIRWPNHQGRYVEDGPTTLLSWSEGGLNYALVGEIGRRELLKIAASIN